MSETRIDVGEAGAGERLDRFLARRLGISRGRVRRLLASGRVRRSGARLVARDKSLPLRSDDVLVVSGALLESAERPHPRPDLRLDILAEGRGWLAVDKPAGAGVHPLRPEQDGTVLNALVARRPAILGVGEGGLRSGVVHRLDVGTSGVLLFASTEEGFAWLRGAFRSHRVDKRYRALVAGRVESVRRVELPLAIVRHRPARVAVVAPEAGRVCRQTVTPVRVFPDATLVEITLETGFLHQIRATLAHLGHPVLGDPAYGSGSGPAGFARPMLHAERVAIDEIDVRAEPPADFVAAVSSLSESLSARGGG